MEYTRTQSAILAALALAVLIACASIARAGVAHVAPICDPYTVQCDSAEDCAAKTRCPR